MSKIMSNRAGIGMFACTAMVATSAAGQVVGVNTAIRNNVQVRQVGGAEAKAAVVKQRVTLGNQVETGSASSLQVTLLDRSTFTVGPNAKFTVNRFVYDPAKRQSSVGTSVAKGTFRLLSGKPAKGGANSVTTPAATIGIRGTIVEGAVGQEAIDLANAQGGAAMGGTANPTSATIIVLRGPGPRAALGEQQGAIDITAGGRTVSLTQPGQAVFVPFAGAAPIGPFQLNTVSFSQFDAVLRTAPQGFAGTMASLQQAFTAVQNASAGGAGGGGAGAGGTGAGGAGGGGTGAAGAGAAGGAAAGGLSSTLLASILAALTAIGFGVSEIGDDTPSSP